MKVGIKKRGTLGVKKIFIEGRIEKIEHKQGGVQAGKENLTVFFRGLEGIGIIQLSPKEVELIFEKSFPAMPEKKIIKPKKSKKTKK
jgi:hypothetical protein